MKKYLSFSAAALMLVFTFSFNALGEESCEANAESDINTDDSLTEENAPAIIVADGAELNFETEPDIIDGTTYVPIRPVLEAYTNMDIDYKTGSSGRILTAYTYNGDFYLDVDNGNYLYDRYDEPDIVSILTLKPYIKDSCTMLPVREILTILGAEVEYDADTKTISFHSEDYNKFKEYIGLPYPIVLEKLENITSLSVIEGISDMTGYEDFAELAKKALDENYNSEDDFDYYPNFCFSEINELKKLSDNEEYKKYIPSFYCLFMCEDFSSFMEIDDSLTIKDSINNIYSFCDDYKAGKILKINSQTEEYARYIFSVFLYYTEDRFFYANDSFNRNGSSQDEQFDYTEHFKKHLTVYDAYIWPDDPIEYGFIERVENYLNKYYKYNKEFFKAIEQNNTKYGLNIEEDPFRPFSYPEVYNTLIKEVK